MNPYQPRKIWTEQWIKIDELWEKRRKQKAKDKKSNESEEEKEVEEAIRFDKKIELKKSKKAGKQ